MSCGLSMQVSFDPSRRPARCVGYYQPAIGHPARTVSRCDGEWGARFQFLAMDPAPGIYGVRWEWS